MGEVRADGEAALGSLAAFTDLAMAGSGVLRSLGPDDVLDAADLVGALVFQAVNTVEALADLDPRQLDPAELTQWAEGIERVRRMAEAAAVAVAGHVDRDNPFRDDGFFSGKAWLRHRLQLSGPEAHRRVQSARMHRRLDDWAEAEQVGGVGVAQSELMGRVAANPRIDDEVLQRDSSMLLEDATTLPFDDFERNVRMWEALADADGDRARNERRKAERHVAIRPRPQGGWTLSGSFDELAGWEFNEIFAHFVDAEWRTDWAEARGRLGDTATHRDLARSDAQRRADALLAIARAAAAADPDATRPATTLNVVYDAESFEAALRGETIDARRYRNVVCRTQSGRRLHCDDAVNAALVGHVRRVVTDSAGVVIDLGRRSRLFRGSAREAVMLLATACVWLGCDRPVEWFDVDHSVAWAAHGATVPRNGIPMCHGHNLLKERGYRVHRDNQGNWHFITPNGQHLH